MLFIFFNTFWNFYEIFVTVVKTSHRKTSWPPSIKCSPLLKSPTFITLQISFTFNQALIFCINTRALVLINQYSTGLFVSYSSRKKPNSTKTFIN